MRNVWIIFRKEIRSYFVSPVAYVLLAAFALICGLLFAADLYDFLRMGLQAQQFGQSFPMNINEMVVRPVLWNMSVIGIFFVPFITMRLFAEEKRTGTIELLATSPIRDSELILGKWLAALGVFGCMLLFMALNFVFLAIYGNPDWKPLGVAYVGLFLQAGALLAVGTLISTMTKNQIVAAAITLVLCLTLWILSAASGFESGLWAQVLSYMAVITHFEPFSKGVFDTRDLIFYVSLIFLGLFLTTRSLESLRWRA